MFRYTNKQKRSIIFAINIGNLLEWYELSLYAYWAPIISDIFFDPSSSSSNLIKTFLILAIGYLIRPIGGVFFGRLGDRIGRRKALLWSIICMTIPTLIMSFLPSYASVGILSPILLCVTRLLQSFPAGGELPGAFCYLYESAETREKKYMTSWGFVGNQIGFILAIIECLVFENLFSRGELITWGWRLSFILGSLIGLYGFYLRSKLLETPVWEVLEKHNKTLKFPILKTLSDYKSKIGKGVAYCAVTAVSFSSLTSFYPIYFEKFLGTSYQNNLLITVIILILVTIPLPFFGSLADRYNYKKIMIFCTCAIIATIITIRVLNNYNVFHVSIFAFGILVILFSCLYAILPFILTDLFPTDLRFTGVGLTYNIADSLIGGFAPAIEIYLLDILNIQQAYFWILIGCSFISLWAYLNIKKRREV